MPVYGLPSALESSLNSLIELQPPTSWRVSGHGNDITVVLRWSLCSSSPSSDQTLAYDIRDNKVTKAGSIKSHVWTHCHKNPYLSSPRAEHTHEKYGGENTSGVSTKVETDVKPHKRGKFKNKSRARSSCSNQSSSPIPLFITTSNGVFQAAPIKSSVTDSPHSTKTLIHGSSTGGMDESSHGALAGYSTPPSAHARDLNEEIQGMIQYAATEGTSLHEYESDLRNGIRAYLTQNESARRSHTSSSKEHKADNGSDVTVAGTTDGNHRKLSASEFVDDTANVTQDVKNEDDPILATQRSSFRITNSVASCETPSASLETTQENDDFSVSQLSTPPSQEGIQCSYTTYSSDCASFGVVTSPVGEQDASPPNDLEMVCSTGSEQCYDYSSSDPNTLSYLDSFDHLQDSVASEVVDGGDIGNESMADTF